MTKDLKRSAPNPVDCQNTGGCTGEGDDSVDSLEEQRFAGGYTDLSEYLGRKVLNGAYASHLTTRLDCHYEDRPAKVGPTTEEIKVPDTLSCFLSCDLRLNHVELGHDV